MSSVSAVRLRVVDGAADDDGMRSVLPLSSVWVLAIASYVTAMRAAGRRPGTIRLHRHYLYQLAGSSASPWLVSLDDLRGQLAGRDWAPETRKSARTVYRSFYRWAHKSGRIEHNPAADLDPVTVPSATPRPTPESVVRALMAQPDPRVRLMGMLAAYAGLRAGEIALVHAADVVEDRLRVHGKGGKVRTVPVVHAQLAARLAGITGWAFPGRCDGHLSPATVTRLLSRAMPAGWTAHTLRHRCATVAYAGTRDLLAVGAVLGHARPETTQRYVQMPDEPLRAALSAAAA